MSHEDHELLGGGAGRGRQGVPGVAPAVEVQVLGRVVAMMALVTECHPFNDGNGRVARLTSNAELSIAGQVRIVIPTVYRNNHLAALSGMSGGAGKGQALMAVLEFAQRWAAAVGWRDYERSLDMLTACNAFLDPGVAEVNGQRLVMPLVP